MKLRLITSTLAIALAGFVFIPGNAQERKGLLLTKEGIANIQADIGNIPLFDSSLQQVIAEVDAEIESGIDTPIPEDFSGGYTHEKHKQNFFILQKAGALFQILEDEKYANFVRSMFFQYAAMYRDLPLHPQTRSYARGKLFWQCLNDANWLVYASQAYDAIYDWLSEEDRNTLETNLFRPFADHISIDSPQFFNRIHNHSTWGAAAVGMIGLVMEDEELIQRALYGLQDDGLANDLRDNDGGFIRVDGQEAGFFANLNEPFSPDGYYTEGPYYQRYAMYPFLMFAQALHNTRPELAVLEYKDGVLLKAVDVLLNLTDANGEFFAINDGQKGMSWHANELVTAVGVAYHHGTQDPRLLGIAQQQGRVLLDDTGYAIATGIRDSRAQPFEKSSANYSDGADGSEGGLGLLRYGDEALTLLFKYTAQGLSHGHYDKLAFSLFERGEEVLQDYGMSRFVNIGQKGGGNYLPENTSWAKQTVAHNTLVQNETSHFGGLYATGSLHHSDLHFFDTANENVQVISAKEHNAYPGTTMHRTLALIKDAEFEKPFVLDILRVNADSNNQYDLPFYYFGQVLDTNFSFSNPQSLTALGTQNGYQHLFLESRANMTSDNARFSWMNNNKFYSLTSTTQDGDEMLLARIGANDPEYNLRRDPAVILRRPEADNTLFTSVIESHGSYNPVTELALNTHSHITRLTILHDDDAYTAVSIETVNGSTRVFVVANSEADSSTIHRLETDGRIYQWLGPYQYFSQ